MSALPEAARELLRRERGEEVAAVRAVPGGANSEAWELTARSGARYLAKRCLRRPGDDTDRLGTEFAALTFLRSHGVRSVPEPVAAIPAESIGVYGFVAGRRLEPGEVGAAEVRQAAAFLGQLHALRTAEGAERLPVAREACFSLAAHEAHVRARLARLRAPAAGDAGGVLAAYLEGEVAPELEETALLVGRAAARRGIDPGAELPPAARTLSPSDFGFHNALRRDDGSLVFIDFEYFGWDDPAKMVADFFLQPAVPVPAGLRRGFFAAVQGFVGDAAGLEARLPLVHALLALKWRLIILNAFLRPGTPADVLARQLAAARAFGERVRAERAAKAFPTLPD